MGGFCEKLGIPGSMKLNFLLVCRFSSTQMFPFKLTSLYLPQLKYCAFHMYKVLSFAKVTKSICYLPLADVNFGQDWMDEKYLFLG